MSFHMHRYHLLKELMLWRARARVGSVSSAVHRRERKILQRELVKLRAKRG